MSFFESSFLWREAVIASTFVASAAALTGVYTIMRRVVFLPAALSQLSGLSVVFTFVLLMFFPSLAVHWFGSPAFISLLFTLIAALLLGWMPEPKRLSKEVTIGFVYIVASALVIVIGDRIPAESHHIEDILFGNAVAVERGQMYIAVTVSALVIVLHVFLMRPFLLVSFDPDTAKAHGVGARFIDSVLFVSMGLVIAVATKTIGALPVFAYTVLPATTALLACDNLKLIFFLAALFGALSAFFGYWISFSLEFPTGACTTTVAALTLGIAALFRLIRKIRRADVRSRRRDFL